MSRRPQAVSPELQRAARKFASWRRTRKNKSRIPESLWELAVELAGVHGVARTATVLRLDYYSLKKRLAASTVAATEPAPAFLELPAGLATGRECVVELEEPGRGRLRVHLKGHDAPDLVALARAFQGAD